MAVSNKAEYHSSIITSTTKTKTYPIKIHVQNEPEGPRFQPLVKVVRVSEDHTTINLKEVITTYAAIDSDTLLIATNVMWEPILFCLFCAFYSNASIQCALLYTWFNIPYALNVILLSLWIISFSKGVLLNLISILMSSAFNLHICCCVHGFPFTSFSDMPKEKISITG